MFNFLAASGIKRDTKQVRQGDAANALHYNFIKDNSLSLPPVKQRSREIKERLGKKEESWGKACGESQKAAKGDNSPRAHCLLLSPVKRESRAWHFYEINTKDVEGVEAEPSGSGSSSHDKSTSDRTMMGRTPIAIKVEGEALLLWPDTARVDVTASDRLIIFTRGKSPTA